MESGNFARECQAKTDVELQRLAMDLEELTSEARASLTGELARRGITPKQIQAFREEELRGFAASGQSGSGISSLIPSQSGSYTVGPALPAEALKAPWRPKTAGRIAFFFGPVAGGLIIAISLRRMKHPERAAKVLRLILGMAVAELAILFFIPEALSRLVGLVIEIAFLLTFPPFMEKEFSEWQASHPHAAPSNGWKAIGWGFAGIGMFFLVGIIVFFVMALFIPMRE